MRLWVSEGCLWINFLFLEDQELIVNFTSHCFLTDMSVSNAWLIRRNGFIRFVPNSDYFNVPAVGVPYPELTFHGWSGFGLNNISDVAIENCEFSRSPGYT